MVCVNGAAAGVAGVVVGAVGVYAEYVAEVVADGSDVLEVVVGEYGSSWCGGGWDAERWTGETAGGDV